MKMNHWKQLVALVAVLALSVSMLTACGQKEVNISEEGVPILASAEDAALEVVTVNGEGITVADLQYYIYNAAMMQLYQNDPQFNGDVSSINWEEKQESGKTLVESVLEDALNQAIADTITIQKGTEQGIIFTEDDKTQMNEMIDSFVTQYGEEVFTLNMNAMGLDSKEEYQKIYERVTMVQMVEEDIQADISKYVSDTEELKKHKSEDKATVQHVLIMSEGSKFENPEDVANEVLAKAKAGEDFVSLMEQYNEDPGATASGYTFGPGEMVEEFEKASFALNFDEISEIVQTDYGYHIIKRLVGAAELQNYWEAEADINKKNGVLKRVSVADIMNAVVNAQTTLQEMSKSEKAAADANGTTEGDSNNG